MSTGLERPKILSAVVLSTDETWAITLDYGGSPQNVSATIPAGRYFVAADGTSDDLIWKMCSLMTTAMRALGGAFANTWVFGFIDANHKVNFIFEPILDTYPIRFRWSATGATLRKALGVGANDETISAGVYDDDQQYTAPAQHGFGWYAEEDGQLENKPVFDLPSAKILQERSMGGIVLTQRLSEYLYDSFFRLAFLPEDLTWSDGKSYGEEQTNGKTKNRALEHWFREAMNGTEFRFYRDYRSDLNSGDDRLPNKIQQSLDATSAGVGTITDSTKSWAVNEFVGHTLHVPYAFQSPGGKPCRWYITANTATQLTLQNQWFSDEFTTGESFVSYGTGNGYLGFIEDTRYGVYVLDVTKAPVFSPEEMPGINHFNITVPVLRYVA